jgi:hypothetical protein
MRRAGVGYRFDVLPEDASFLEEARAYGVQATIVLKLARDTAAGHDCVAAADIDEALLHAERATPPA